jgi:hypothetical protein
MLKHTLIYRLALIAVFALSVVACKEDEDPIPGQPSIASVTPAEALPGAEVIISGANLAWADEVRFGETEATIVNNTGSNIITLVPANAAFGSQQITVTTAGGSATHAFTVLEPAVEPSLSFTADETFFISGFGGTAVLTASVENPVSRVVFFEGENELGEATEAPYTWEYEIGEEVEPYTNFPVTARVYGEDNNELESAELTIRVGERLPVSSGTLTGNGDEVFNEDGPTGGAYPSDGKYAAMINWDGGGDIEAASGINIPVTIPEEGNYMVSMGLASGWDQADSFMRIYFNDEVDNVQRSPEVPPTGWIDFNDYLLDEPFELPAGEQMAKVRYGGDWVHTYYIDLFKF